MVLGVTAQAVEIVVELEVRLVTKQDFTVGVAVEAEEEYSGSNCCCC